MVLRLETSHHSYAEAEPIGEFKDDDASGATPPAAAAAPGVAAAAPEEGDSACWIPDWTSISRAKAEGPACSPLGRRSYSPVPPPRPLRRTPRDRRLNWPMPSRSVARPSPLALLPASPAVSMSSSSSREAVGSSRRAQLALRGVARRPNSSATSSSVDAPMVESEGSRIRTKTCCEVPTSEGQALT